MFKHLIFTPFILSTFFQLSCSQKSLVNKPLIDIEKTCGERIKLVEKIMLFNKTDFEVSAEKSPKWGIEQTWDLKKANARKAGLQWLQIKFERGRLQSVWFGPRTNLKNDLKMVGLSLYDLRSEQGHELKSYDLGTYNAKNLLGQKIIVEHQGAPQKGTFLTCFKAKNF